MRRTTRIWLSGLLAALVSGGASGLASALSAMQVAPETFDAGVNLGATLKLALGTALLSGWTGAAQYLRQSPIPKVLSQKIETKE